MLMQMVTAAQFTPKVHLIPTCLVSTCSQHTYHVHG